MENSYTININTPNQQNEYGIYKIEDELPKIEDKENTLLKNELFIAQKTFTIETNNTKQKIYIQTPQYKYYSSSVIYNQKQKALGSIKELFSLRNKKYKIYDNTNKELFTIKGNFKGFTIFKNKTKIGQITPSTTEKSLKILTKNTAFTIELFENISQDEIILLYSAIIHIDKSYMKKTLIREIIKRVILYPIYSIFVILLLLSFYRAYYIFSLTNNLILDTNISIEDTIDALPIEQEQSLTYDKNFTNNVQKIYSQKIYENFDASKLFENNTTMTQEKKDFFQLLDLYIKTDRVLTIKDDSLFYQIPYNENHIVSSVFDSGIYYFYESLVYYIQYLDTHNNVDKSNEILVKLVQSLNYLMEKSYHFDYILANSFYRFIFETLQCKDKNRALLFENNSTFFKQLFIKRLKAHTLLFQKSYPLIVNEAYQTSTLQDKNKIFRIAVALYKKGNDELLKYFESDGKKQKDINFFNHWYYIDMINSIIFYPFDYTNLFVSNMIVETELQRLEKIYSRIMEIINLQEKWLKNCSEKN